MTTYSLVSFVALLFGALGFVFTQRGSRLRSPLLFVSLLVALLALVAGLIAQVLP